MMWNLPQPPSRLAAQSVTKVSTPAFAALRCISPYKCQKASSPCFKHAVTLSGRAAEPCGESPYDELSPRMEMTVSGTCWSCPTLAQCSFHGKQFIPNVVRIPQGSPCGIRIEIAMKQTAVGPALFCSVCHSPTPSQYSLICLMSISWTQPGCFKSLPTFPSSLFHLISGDSGLT